MTIVKQTRIDPLPVGEYTARIGEIEPTEGQFGPQLKVRFDLQGEHLGREVLGWCSQSFTPKSKLYGWARAAFGRDIPPDYDLDTVHLLGKPVKLVLVTKTGDDGMEYNRIDSVKPYRNGSSAPAPAPAAVNVVQGPPLPAEPPAELEDELPF